MSEPLSTIWFNRSLTIFGRDSGMFETYLQNCITLLMSAANTYSSMYS